MKFKLAAFVLLFTVLSILSLYSFQMYQQILSQDAAEGELLSQVKVVKLDYNFSDLFDADSGGSILCNITYQNPTNSAVELWDVRVEYYTNPVHWGFPKAYGSYTSAFMLNSRSSSTISVEVNVQEANNTSPAFRIMTDAGYDISARELGSTVQGRKINNWVNGRSHADQTYGLLSFYSTLSTIVWIVGIGPAVAVMLFLSKGKTQVRRWAAGVFALNLFGIFALLLLWYLPKPLPSVYSNYFPLGAGSGFAEWVFLLGLILGGGLNLYALSLLFRDSQHAKIMSFLAGGFMIAAFILSFFGSTTFASYWNNSAVWFFPALAAVNALTLLRLRQYPENDSYKLTN
ncbi:MAG: hypothetical protein NWE93_13550 [Candidatus Bathyarchaeota archaeon]|nr:hypothetical protein [Candidatus Bathyarchaeota archaeon]